MLIACHGCHRQFDTTGLKIGAKVRCLCTQLLTVPDVKPRDMAMLRCSSCGGHLGKNDKECGFCGSDVSLAERGYGGTCPECYARMPKDARFCSTCGVGINPVGKLSPLHGKACPRCDGDLAIEEFDAGSLVECTGCGGLWLEEKSFAAITKNAETNAVAKYVRGRARARELPEVPHEGNVRYLKCPTCSQIMHRKNYAGCSGIVVDWCRGHGYWFDRHELEGVLQFIRDGGHDKAREKERLQHEMAMRREDRKRDATPIELDAYRQRRQYGSESILDTLSGLIGGLFR